VVTNAFDANKRDIYYLYNDYQGSLIAVLKQGSPQLEEISFDPWGRRRNAGDWNDYSNTGNGFDSFYKRGYTGHEHIDNFALINMNGRMYDPRLGRFLSPDPYVQAPDYTQSYNRYSYVWNNPMKYTDPSGEIVSFALFLIGSYAIGAMYHGQQPDGSFNWKKANQGGLAAMAIAGTMVASAVLPGLVPAWPGALPGLMLAGGQFGSTAMNTGAWNWMSTGNFKPNWKSAGFSAIPGLIMAGVGGINVMRRGGNFLTGDGAIFEFSGTISSEANGNFAFANDEELEAFLKQHIDYDDFGLLEVTAFKDPSVLKNRGDYLYFRDGNGMIFRVHTTQPGPIVPIGGFAQAEYSGFISFKSRIYMSRYADLTYFKGILNHELIHSYHISKGLMSWGLSYKDYTERIAYEYSLRIGQANWQKVHSFNPGPRSYIMPPYLIPIP
jgi:RHS repeat-associated protein